jgi:hypothetical protein
MPLVSLLCDVSSCAWHLLTFTPAILASTPLNMGVQSGRLRELGKASRVRVEFILVFGISMQFPYIYKGSAKRLAEAFAELSSIAISVEPIH